MKRFKIPSVGTKVKVTTEDTWLYAWKQHGRAYFIGEVVPNASWQSPDTFNVFTGNRLHPVSIINIASVVSIVDHNGIESDKIEAKEEPHCLTFKVDSSKPGKFYTVMKAGQHWTCDCPGFGFRRNCRHINEMKQKFV